MVHWAEGSSVKDSSQQSWISGPKGGGPVISGHVPVCSLQVMRACYVLFTTVEHITHSKVREREKEIQCHALSILLFIWHHQSVSDLFLLSRYHIYYHLHPNDGEGNVFTGICPLTPWRGGGGWVPHPLIGVLSSESGGYPLPRQRVPLSRWGVLPSQAGGYPYWNSIACTCYAAGRMPHSFTQEDFLVKPNVLKWPFMGRLRLMHMTQRNALQVISTHILIQCSSQRLIQT